MSSGEKSNIHPACNTRNFLIESGIVCVIYGISYIDFRHTYKTLYAKKLVILFTPDQNFSFSLSLSPHLRKIKNKYYSSKNLKTF